MDMWTTFLKEEGAVEKQDSKYEMMHHEWGRGYARTDQGYPP